MWLPEHLKRKRAEATAAQRQLFDDVHLAIEGLGFVYRTPKTRYKVWQNAGTNFVALYFSLTNGIKVDVRVDSTPENLLSRDRLVGRRHQYDKGSRVFWCEYRIVDNFEIQPLLQIIKRISSR